MKRKLQQQQQQDEQRKWEGSPSKLPPPPPARKGAGCLGWCDEREGGRSGAKWVWVVEKLRAGEGLVRARALASQGREVGGDER